MPSSAGAQLQLIVGREHPDAAREALELFRALNVGDALLARVDALELLRRGEHGEAVRALDGGPELGFSRAAPVEPPLHRGRQRSAFGCALAHSGSAIDGGKYGSARIRNRA